MPPHQTTNALAPDPLPPHSLHMQARVTELQHSYVATVASCVGEADAVEARDVLRRARLAGLERDAAAGGAVGPPEADPWDRRPAAKVGYG